jgi:hypothetical protein
MAGLFPFPPPNNSCRTPREMCVCVCVCVNHVHSFILTFVLSLFYSFFPIFGHHRV